MKTHDSYSIDGVEKSYDSMTVNKSGPTTYIITHQDTTKSDRTEVSGFTKSLTHRTTTIVTSMGRLSCCH